MRMHHMNHMDEKQKEIHTESIRLYAGFVPGAHAEGGATTAPRGGSATWQTLLPGKSVDLESGWCLDMTVDTHMV